MHIPMETLSQLTTRTDSGTGVSLPASRSAHNKANARFDEIFDGQLQKQDRKMHGKQRNPVGNTENSKSVRKAETAIVNGKNNAKDEIIDDKGMAQAAGVMGEQEQEVVFILEGEESVATPEEMRVESTAGQEPIISQPAVTEQEKVLAQDAQGANTVENAPPQTAQHAENPEIAVIKETIAAKTDAANVETDKSNAAGEVTARMPEVKPEGKEQNTQTGDNLKDDGNPRPLENENEKTQVQGQDDKTHFDAIRAVKNKANSEKDDKAEDDGQKDGQEGKAYVSPKENAASVANETVAPPLSEGIKPEQFKGTQQMTQAAANTHPVKPENLFDEMISRVETAQNAAKSTMTIQLNPEFLGRVTLEVAADAAGLHVKINAEDSNVRGMINSQLATLIESLQSKGIAIAEVDVVFAGANFETFSQSNSGQQETGSQRQTGKQESYAKESIEYYTALTDLMDYYLDTGVSSVEYRA